MVLIIDLIQSVLAWGWLLVVFLVLWLAWETYKVLKMLDYVNAVEWTFLQITLPDNAEQTPKAMQHAFDVWSGIHKSPDLVEKYFEGYLEAWYSCEVQCTSGKARYIMVVPANHRKFFEGVIYGQYPSASVTEVEDYSQTYQWQDIGKKFDIYGAEVDLTKEDIYPIKTYLEYEDPLAPEDRFIDPHQSLIEAYTNVKPGEEYWYQVLIRPMAGQDIEQWATEGEEAVRKISGQAKEKEPGILTRLKDFTVALPGELLQVILSGKPLEAEKKDEKATLRFFNPVDEAKMKGIVQKISQGGYKTKIRVIHIAPPGELHKPNISRAIGALKQFNTFHLNGIKPDEATKTNGPNYVLKQTRRRFRQRRILLYYQWRDFWGYTSGKWLNAEELATLYHFPAKWVKAPLIQRAKAGLQSAPENLPYV